MSTTHEIVYRNRTVTITVAADGHGKYIGSFTVPGTDPLIQDSAADESSAEEALSTAERKVKELIDQRGL
jgi:hypothetical protein